MHLSQLLPSVALSLHPYYNNKATSLSGQSVHGGFDGVGATYPIDCLPTGSFEHNSVKFELPDNWTALPYDNIVADAQTIFLPEPTEVSELHLLVAGDWSDGGSKEKIELSFVSGSKGEVQLDVKNWWSLHWLNKGVIRCPYHFTSPSQRSYNSTQIHLVVLPLSSTSALTSLRLPPRAPLNALHIFAITLIQPLPTIDPFNVLQATTVRATSNWENDPLGRAQIVLVTLRNPHSQRAHPDRRAWVSEPLKVGLRGLQSGWEVVRTGRVERLSPGDSIEVELLVRPSAKGKGRILEELENVEVVAGKVDGQLVKAWTIGRLKGAGTLVRDWDLWENDPTSLEFHESPKWFNQAKFGIFIHWGLYSIPAWTNQGRYAEWYWYWLHQDRKDSESYNHHLEEYGANFKYDDFIPSFDGSKFNATSWIDLFTLAGAKYFVLTTKHHDGFALFDTLSTSNRSSVALSPGKRDYVKELFEKADEMGGIKKGAYFSMPEWFNPDYARYGWQGFPGGLAKDVYHPGKFEHYTGHIPVKDYVEDMQLKQMKILGDADIMWCDIGGANHTSTFASEWYTNSSRIGRQVAMNDRCGIAPDFSTPEYERFATVQAGKWETCEGIDPFSFGYNKATKDSEYRTSKEIIHNLIDITSKNGNYLLNIGPTGQGEIVPVMVRNLLETGKWLKVNGKAIYDTTPFPLLPELILPHENLNIRFTRTSTSFFIISLNRPSTPVFVIPARLPILHGDRILFLSDGEEEELDWEFSGGAQELRIAIGDRIADRGRMAWTFEARYLGSQG